MVDPRGACQDYSDAWFVHEKYSLKHNLENIPLTEPKFCKHSDCSYMNAGLPNQFSNCHCIKHYNFKFAKDSHKIDILQFIIVYKIELVRKKCIKLITSKENNMKLLSTECLW